MIEFRSTTDLFIRYLQLGKVRHPGEISSDLAQEAIERFRQIDWLVQQVFSLCKHMSQAPLKSDDFLMTFESRLKPQLAVEEGDLLNQGGFIVRAYTESFYYIAFRLRTLLRKGMPHLSSFESVGIRNVRNHLIEHPEGSKVFVQTFDVGLSQEGPRLKVDENQTVKEHIDEGLFVNAKAFKADLETALQKALENMK